MLNELLWLIIHSCGLWVCLLQCVRGNNGPKEELWLGGCSTDCWVLCKPFLVGRSSSHSAAEPLCSEASRYSLERSSAPSPIRAVKQPLSSRRARFHKARPQRRSGDFAPLQHPGRPRRVSLHTALAAFADFFSSGAWGDTHRRVWIGSKLCGNKNAEPVSHSSAPQVADLIEAYLIEINTLEIL